VRVFVSAAREARPYCGPGLISGQLWEIRPDQERAQRVEVAATRQFDNAEPVELVAVPTGRDYNGTPWWEIYLTREGA
jgi:hypothetical protein